MEYDSIPGRLLLIMMVDMGRIHTKFAVPDGFETVPTTMWWIFFFFLVLLGSYHRGCGNVS
jgi:hypothetical protein